jgi:hypothetical protein
MGCSDTRSTPFWYHDVSILWKDAVDFFPTASMTEEERLNAMVRFALYAGAGVALAQQQGAPLFWAVAVVAVISLLYMSRTRRRMRMVQSYPRTFSCRPATSSNPYMNTPASEFGKPVWKACPCDKSKSQALAMRNTVSDMDDIFHDDVASRPFLSLPNGGAAPNFAELGTALGKGSGLLGSHEDHHIRRYSAH